MYKSFAVGAGIMLVSLAAVAAASAQPVYVAPGFAEPGLPPYEIMSIVRSTGLTPVTRPMRRGPNYVLVAIDRAGRQMRVVVDARLGDIVNLHPAVAGGDYGAGPYGPAPYGPGSNAPGAYGPNPYGSGPYGANPYGPNPNGLNSNGPNSYGPNPYGPGPYGQAASPAGAIGTLPPAAPVPPASIGSRANVASHASIDSVAPPGAPRPAPATRVAVAPGASPLNIPDPPAPPLPRPRPKLAANDTITGAVTAVPPAAHPVAPAAPTPPVAPKESGQIE